MLKYTYKDRKGEITMKRFCAFWDIITWAVLAVAIILKVIFAFSWWWIIGAIGIIIIAEVTAAVIMRRKLFSGD